MQELASEAAIEILTLVGSAVAATVFTAGGLLAEGDGIRNLLTGNLTLGGWEIAVGLLFLVAGLYLLGYQEFWQRLSVLRSGG